MAWLELVVVHALTAERGLDVLDGVLEPECVPERVEDEVHDI